MLASPPPHKDFTLSPPHMLLLRRVEQEGFSCALLSMWELGPMKLRGVVDSPRPHSKMAAGGRPGLLLPLFFFWNSLSRFNVPLFSTHGTYSIKISYWTNDIH